MEHPVSLPGLQEPATCPYPKSYDAMNKWSATLRTREMLLQFVFIFDMSVPYGTIERGSICFQNY